MPDALLTSLSALSAQQRAMEVTSHNIANAATPGYTRQRVEMNSKVPEDVRPGQLGRGVDITAIRRISDALVNQRIRQAEGESGRLATLKTNLETLQQTFNEPGENGLSAIIGRMFAGLEDLSNNPESAAVRAAAVAGMTTWADTVANLGDSLTQMRDDLQLSLEDDIAEINGLTAAISSLNRQIRSQVAVGQQPNDLMDQREKLLGELTTKVDGRVLVDGRSQSVSVLINGRMLVGPDQAVTLSANRDADGNLSITTDTGSEMPITGGSVGALAELHRTILPQVAEELDSLVASVIQALNARQSTGASNSLRTDLWQGDRVISLSDTGLDLDDPALNPSSSGQTGIPEAFAPSFTDADGVAVARNLTINVLDTTTGVAAKYTVRFNPAVGGGERSLSDLVSAINTGRGGGFSLFPPLAGIPGVNASLASAEGGVRLQIRAESPTTSIDFSSALDTSPGATAWTGTGSVTVSGTAVPALGVERLQVQVNATGTALQLIHRDPLTGQSSVLGSAAVPGAGSTAVTINGITLTVNAGTFRAGDRFGVSLAAGTGQVLNPTTGLAGPHVQASTWAAGNPTLSIRGRYTGSLSDPAQPWSMRVVTAGVIGAAAGTAAPGNPPTVEFTVWTGSPANPVRQVISKVLDDRIRAGQPIALTDGVYATLSAGTFATAGNQVDFTVDGAPDQAGLLPALGINQLLHSDGTASSLRMDRLIAGDPSRIATGTTRNEGDNSNVLNLLAIRKQATFGESGRFKFEDAYLSLVSGVGVQVDETTRLGENQDALKASLDHQRNLVSGVSIDDEVGTLILQQQAYSAAARMVTAARENIQTLLDILR